MIPPTGINDPTPFIGTGWLRDYMNACSNNTYPRSYHLLSAMFALGGIIGRRAAIERSSFTMYPSLSIILLGTSGIGKSSAIKIAGKVVGHAATINRIPYMRSKLWISLTPRGLMDKWIEIQRDHDGCPIEGVEIIDEMTGALKSRKGNELVNEWLIGALAHGDVRDVTANRGEAEVTDFTVGFGFCGVMSTLRSAVTEESFAGGFMHRFAMAYELDQDFDQREEPIAEDTLKDLAASALRLRRDAPPTMELSESAGQRLTAILNDTRGKPISRASLHGFWNRINNVCCKIAMLFAISEGRWTVELADVDLAEKLVRGHLYPGIEGVAEQLGASGQMRRLYDVHENLVASRSMGISLNKVYMSIGHTSERLNRNAVEFMDLLGLAHLDNTWSGNGDGKGRVWATKGWAVEAKRKLGVER